jgi:hypothetical protein
MQGMYDRLRASLPNAKFSPPATPEQIARVEKGLEVQFPDWLRELYLHCNGIRGTYAIYLYALERNDDFLKVSLTGTCSIEICGRRTFTMQNRIGRKLTGMDWTLEIY